MPNTPNVEVIQPNDEPISQSKAETQAPKKVKYDEAITAFNNATAKALDTLVNLEA